MINVVIHWDNAAWINDPDRIRTVMKFYTLTMKAFGLDHMDVITTEEVGWTDAEIDFHTFASLEECVNTHPDQKYVVLEKADNYPDKIFTNIRDYVHPEDNVSYVIGSDYSQVDLSVIPDPDLITISTVVPVPLWSHVVLGIMLAARNNL